jgi:hypothetical protein
VKHQQSWRISTDRAAYHMDVFTNQVYTLVQSYLVGLVMHQIAVDRYFKGSRKDYSSKKNISGQSLPRKRRSRIYDSDGISE